MYYLALNFIRNVHSVTFPLAKLHYVLMVLGQVGGRSSKSQLFYRLCNMR